MLKIPPNVKTIGITCLQWGDTGKGKVVDLLADWAEIVVRGTGGANAGHSVCLGDKSFAFHLIPSGILHDADGVVNAIGSGAAIDPGILCKELQLLSSQGLPYENLMIALNAKLTLPMQIVRDRVGEGSAGAGKIGTTGRGIGPTYSDHASRVGLLVNDLLNYNALRAKVLANAEFSARILRSYDPEMVRAVLHQPHLRDGAFYDPKKIFNGGAIVEYYYELGNILSPFIKNVDEYVQSRVGVRNILLEGAQGTLLDVDYGLRPYVTSSNCTIDGLAKGAGLNRSHVDLALGVFKGFYMTRVGEGPFPTELGARASAEWCSKATQQVEKDAYPNVTVNDRDEFRQGVALRFVGNEYGATTRRPRRTGWLDLPLLRYALRWGSPNVVLTKLDVLDDCDCIKVCCAYEYFGAPYIFGDRKLTAGVIPQFVTAIPVSEVLEYCRPVYREFPGWKKSIRGISNFEDLPTDLRRILDFVVAETGINPRIISVGPDRNETIFV